MSQSVSVAIATYNGGAYLQEQLESIARQTVLPTEVVICDDASSDNTVAVIKEFASCAPFPVRLLVNEHNVGYTQNFNRALEECKSEIVFLCDQDDVWLPEKIERTLELFRNNPLVVLTIHDLAFCSKELIPVGQTKLERMSDGYEIMRDYVVGMATAVRRSFLQMCLPIPNQAGMAHDRWLHDCALAVEGKVIVEEVLAQYRRHNTNATAESAVNVGFMTNRWTFLWDRFREPSKIKLLPSIPDSPLSDWLSERRHELIMDGYLKSEDIDALIKRENEKTMVLRERNRLLQLSRWRRVVPVARLFCKGGYHKFFSWGSAVKDLVRS
jgi:glycosyltransferase involved in cell wall biosynthesis